MCKFWLFTVPLAVCVFAGHVPAKGDVTGETVHACSTLSVAMFSMDGSNQKSYFMLFDCGKVR